MLNQRFFQEELPRLQTAYQAGQNQESAQPEVLLKHGVFLRMEGEIDAGPEYLMFDYKLRDVKRRAVVPYDSIVAISLGPAEKEKTRVGLI